MAYDSTLKGFLKGISPLVTESAVTWVCIKRDIDPEEEYTDLDERSSDLLEATMYYWLSNLPVGGATRKVADGNWSKSEGGWQVSNANIAEWLRKYRSLYAKWEEEPIVKSKIRIINF